MSVHYQCSRCEAEIVADVWPESTSPLCCDCTKRDQRHMDRRTVGDAIGRANDDDVAMAVLRLLYDNTERIRQLEQALRDATRETTTPPAADAATALTSRNVLRTAARY